MEQYAHSPIDRRPQPTDNYRLDSEVTVRARFEVYNLPPEQDKLDFEAAAIIASGIFDNPNNSFLDVGTADAGFLQRARHEFRLPASNRLVGIDTHSNQFNSRRATEREQRLDELLRAKLNDIVEVPVGVIPGGSSDNLELLEASVTDMSCFNDNEFDVVSALFMLYHVPEDLQGPALREIKRVLTPTGLAIVATSGANNKSIHRQYEERIASRLDAQPPHIMNASFTSEHAKALLPRFYDQVFMLEQEADAPIDTLFARDVWLNSQLSLFDQYYREAQPITLDEFTNVLTEIGTELMREPVTDHISRSLFLCSDDMRFEPRDISGLTTKYSFTKLT